MPPQSESVDDVASCTEQAPPGSDDSQSIRLEDDCFVENENGGAESSSKGGEEVKLFQFMTGIREDLKERVPLYKDDWSRPKSVFTVINATVFAFVIQLIPALIFAELMARETQGNLATAEVLLSSAIIGIVYAVFAGQPLVIMGITGPVAILLGTSYGLTENFDAAYFPFFFWVCLWAGLMHVLSAMVGLVSLVWKVTPFTCQIFELFIAVSFVYLSLRDLIEPLYIGEGGDREDRSAQYATFLLGILTYYISWTLHFAEAWVFFTRQIRTALTSYNTLIAVVVVTAVSYLPGVDQGDRLDRVTLRTVPWDWRPTADRSWVANPLDGIDSRGILGAIVPGFMFFLLFIIDHNVSSILSQSPKFNLQKPAAYHWDFFVLGVTFLPCAILGLPPGNGLIPQAPLHVRALCTRKTVEDAHGVKREVVTHAEEQRWSGLGQALLMFVALLLFTMISWIPRGALFGLLLYLGVGALHCNEIWERFLFCFMIRKKRPAVPVVREVRWRTVVCFTAIQMGCALAIFAVANFTDAGFVYPALLMALVPIRSYILSHFFSEEDLKHLDPAGETEEDYHADQRAVHEAWHNGSFDLEELEFASRASFRGQGIEGALHRPHRHDSVGSQGSEKRELPLYAGDSTDSVPQSVRDHGAAVEIGVKEASLAQD